MCLVWQLGRRQAQRLKSRQMAPCLSGWVVTWVSMMMILIMQLPWWYSFVKLNNRNLVLQSYSKFIGFLHNTHGHFLHLPPWNKDPFITIALFVTDYGLFLFPLILFDKHTTLFFDFEVHIFGTLTFSDIAKLMYFELLMYFEFWIDLSFVFSSSTQFISLAVLLKLVL